MASLVYERENCIGTTITSKVIEKNIVLGTWLSCLLSVYCVRHLVNAKLGRPAFKALRKIGDEKYFVPGLSRDMVTGSMKILAGRLFS